MSLDIKRMMEIVGDVAFDTRSQYHLTLGGLINALGVIPVDYNVIINDNLEQVPCGPHSYRGYYTDLAFSTTSERTNVKEFSAICADMLDKNLEGYKGGTFTMEEKTPLWISSYGFDSQLAVVDFEIDDENKLFKLKTKQLKEY